jgi:hypothetical protein
MSPSTRLPVLVQSIDDLSLGATKQRDDPNPSDENRFDLPSPT